jgi:cell division protein FtsB
MYRLQNNGSENVADNVRYPYASHRGRHGRSSRMRLIFILSIALIVETVALLFLFIRLTISEKENLDLTVVERKQALELEALKPEVEKLRAEIAALTTSRLPNLNKLEFDKVIPLDMDYVKNIVFTVAGKNSDKHYEYKIVMHNSGLSLIHPEVDILFFDRVGIQVGLSKIGFHQDGTPNLDMLERGEVRSFSLSVELADDANPEYFRIKIYK